MFNVISRFGYVYVDFCNKNIMLLSANKHVVIIDVDSSWPITYLKLSLTRLPCFEPTIPLFDQNRSAIPSSRPCLRHGHLPQRRSKAAKLGTEPRTGAAEHGEYPPFDRSEHGGTLRRRGTDQWIRSGLTNCELPCPALNDGQGCTISVTSGSSRSSGGRRFRRASSTG